MSVVFTGTYQGTFTSTGVNKFIYLPAGVDYMYVRNRTQSYASASGQGVEFYWQLGMTQGRGTIYTKTAATNALAIGQIAANSGFFLQDTSVQTPGASVALTGITSANPPVVNTGSTAGLVASSTVVRIFNTVGALQLGGLDFTVGTVVANTSFTLAYMAAIASANPGAGTYRIIPFDPIYYPRRRIITKISQAAQAIVTLSVTHGYTVGQVVRFIVPTVTALAYGMTELDGLQGTIVAVGAADADGITNTITVDIDTSGFTAFAFPLTTAPGFSPAQIVPIGENTAEALILNANILSDATINQAQYGMLLVAGSASPAGANADVIDWVAGKSWNV